ncbi:hypothetical protein AVEN_61111-1, partial [Araneus ventricosus]
EKYSWSVKETREREHHITLLNIPLNKSSLLWIIIRLAETILKAHGTGKIENSLEKYSWSVKETREREHHITLLKIPLNKSCLLWIIIRLAENILTAHGMGAIGPDSRSSKRRFEEDHSK